MSDTIVIAELSKGKISQTTNELVTAAKQLGSSCTICSTQSKTPKSRTESCVFTTAWQLIQL